MKKILFFVFVISAFIFSSTQAFAAYIDASKESCSSAPKVCRCDWGGSLLIPNTYHFVSCSNGTVVPTGGPAGTQWEITTDLSNNTCEASYIPSADCQMIDLHKSDACSCSGALGSGVITKSSTKNAVSKGMPESLANKIQSYLSAHSSCPAQGDLAFEQISCVGVVPESYCCCVDMTEQTGSLTSRRVCEEKSDVPGTQSCAAEDFDADVIGSNNNFSVLQFDNGCTKYEEVKKDYKASSSTVGVSLDNLKQEAKSLNPMNFKIGLSGVNSFVGKAIKMLMSIMGSVLLLLYVWAGFLWMTAAGNSEQTGKAQKIIVWATAGVVVQLAAYVLVKLLFDTLA